MTRQKNVAKMSQSEWEDHLCEAIFVRGISYEAWLCAERLREKISKSASVVLAVDFSWSTPERT